MTHDDEKTTVQKIDARVTNQHNYIDEIAKSVARQDGQWKILLWGIVLVFGSVVGLGYLMYQGANETQKSLTQLDKTFSSYMMVDISQSSRRNKTIDKNTTNIFSNREMLRNHENRIHMIEDR